MEFNFTKSDEFLIVRLSGVTSPNERLIFRQAISPHLQTLHPKVIVDLSDLNERGAVYLVGVLNTIRKEIQILGGDIRLCALRPRLYRYFRENRLLEFFETRRTLEEAKRSFRKRTDEGKG